MEILGTHAHDFTIFSQPSSSIPFSENTSFEVIFTPSADGRRTAVINITNNDSNENLYEFSIQGSGGIMPHQPLDLIPESGSVNVTLDPYLEASAFIDLEQGDWQTASEWQMFLDDNTLIYHQIVDANQLAHNPTLSFTRINLPRGILMPETTYKWRVRYKDGFNQLWSEWSDFNSFTTAAPDPEYANQMCECPSVLTDLNIRGAIISEYTNNKVIPFSFENEQITVTSINPQTLPQVGRPAELPLGVFAIRIEDLELNDSIIVTLYIPGNYESGIWYKYEPILGWFIYEKTTLTYNSETGYTTVDIPLQDGGDGDCDGVANGIIVDPGGPTLSSETIIPLTYNNDIADNDSGCFIESILDNR